MTCLIMDTHWSETDRDLKGIWGQHRAGDTWDVTGEINVPLSD